MKNLPPLLWAVLSVQLALLSDWLSMELFMRRDSLSDIILAVALNIGLLALVIWLLKRALPLKLFMLVIQLMAGLGFLALFFTALQSSMNLALPKGTGGRLLLIIIASGLLTIFMSKLKAQQSVKLMYAIAYGAMAFILVPYAVRFFTAPSPLWINAHSTASPQKAIIFLLLDEMGAKSAQPLVQDLQKAGLHVQYRALTPAGESTLNVIPALFTGQSFHQARSCGYSSLCSQSHILDFSRIKVARADVDVTGLLVPYCDIQGLRSCYQLPLPHEYGSAYKSLLQFYARRLALPIPEIMRAPPMPQDQQSIFIKQQRAFIDASPFWQKGGILYAHLPLPHPPGLQGMHNLDSDYAANIDYMRTLIEKWQLRAAEQFGANYTIILTSDHPLRSYWCGAESYGPERCKVRPSFQDDKVPLIIASTKPVEQIDIVNNKDVFSILNREAAKP